ncbi:hypothetical protein CP532_6261 [Ophiocordyceps camponoti-leonardi (nom. inval.)]|nr:hypothetical protein CP532_6261 [Ophiocordyceps camponoti-leonardi (nom. inval.)]
MAYAQWIVVMILNALTNRDIQVQNAAVSYGKFWAGDDKDNELPVSEVNKIIVAPGTTEQVQSCGRSSALSGTTGSFELVDLSNGLEIANISWNCPWGSTGNEFLYDLNPAARSLYQITVVGPLSLAVTASSHRRQRPSAPSACRSLSRVHVQGSRCIVVSDSNCTEFSRTVAMSAQNSAGIQTLLDAEREASKIVQKAREYRTKRIREARDEAKKEITNYKTTKDEEFKKFETEHSQGNKEAEDEAAKEAEKQIKVIKNAGQKSKDAVVKNLLNAVFDVKPVPPSAA